MYPKEKAYLKSNDFEQTKERSILKNYTFCV